MTRGINTRSIKAALILASLAGGAVAAAAILGAFDSASAIDLPPVAKQMSAFARQAPLGASAVPSSVKPIGSRPRFPSSQS